MTTDYSLPRFNGTIAHVAIQCTSPEGVLGSFLFTGSSHREPGSRCSPVFSDCMKLANWAFGNGFESVGFDYLFHRIDQQKEPDEYEQANRRELNRMA